MSKNFKTITIVIIWLIFIALVFDPKIGKISKTKLPVEKVSNKIMTEERSRDVDKIEKEMREMGGLTIDGIVPYLFIGLVIFAVAKFIMGGNNGGSNGGGGGGGGSAPRGRTPRGGGGGAKPSPRGGGEAPRGRGRGQQ